MTRRVLVGMLVSLAFLMGTQAEVEESGRRTGAGSEAVPRLFYLFSLDVPSQVQRARLLQDAAFSWDRRLRVVGIVRRGRVVDPQGDSVEAVGRRFGIGCPLWSAGEALERYGLSALLPEEGVGEEEDYALLLDESGNLLRSGSGEDLLRFLSAAGRDPVSTEVDDSTWGKIKELFQ